MQCMTSVRRANGTGTVYIKHGSYYGRWYAADGGRHNRKLGAVRRPGRATGLTRVEAEKRLRELMSAAVVVATDGDRSIAMLGAALVASLEAKGRSRSHIQTVETHLRLHLIPCFGDRSVDRITEDDVTRLIVGLRRKGLAAKTIRNIASTLHSLLGLALRKRWIRENVCSLIDLPAVKSSADVRYSRRMS
jgi:hypothetical protein